MSIVSQWRKEISCKEAALLLTNPPTKQIAGAIIITKCIDKTQANDRIAYWQEKIQTFSTSAALHQGYAHGTSGTSSNVEFPEPLLCILWMHRWAIADETSYENFRKLLRTDITFKIRQQRRFDFYNPGWLRKNIINNVLQTIKVLVDDQKVKLREKYADPKKIVTRLKTALMHHLTTEIVKNLLWCGPNPKMLPPKDRTDDQEQLAKQNQNLKDIDDQLRINLSKLKQFDIDIATKRSLPLTITEAILAAIPNIIEANIENPVAGTMFDNILKDHPNTSTQASWVSGTSWKQFKIYIPLTTTVIPGSTSGDSSVRQPDCDITSFFKNVLQGNIPSKLLFLPSIKKGKGKNATRKRDAPPKIDISKALSTVATMKGAIECVKEEHIKMLLHRHIDDLCAICNIEEEVVKVQETPKRSRK